MDNTLRSILWILILLVVLSSFSTGWFFVAKERLHNDYVSLDTLFRTTAERLNREIASAKEENSGLKLKLSVAENELKRIESRNNDLKSKYEALLKDREDLDKELARVKKGKFYLEKKMKNISSEMFVTDLLKAKAELEIELKKLKNALRPKDLEIEQLKVENAEFSSKLSEFKEEKDFLAQKIRDSEEVAEVLSRDLLREKNLNLKDKEESENIRAENRFLRNKVAAIEETTSDINALVAEKKDMERVIAGLKRDLDYKDREIRKMEVALSEQSRKNVEARAEAYHTPQEVDLPPIVLERSSYTADTAIDITDSPDWLNRPSGLRGNVVTINREHNFVVIDLGKYHGVETGDRFNIYRGEILIGTLEAIQCRDRIAACDITDIKDGFYIEIDDEIVKR